MRYLLRLRVFETPFSTQINVSKAMQVELHLKRDNELLIGVNI